GRGNLDLDRPQAKGRRELLPMPAAEKNCPFPPSLDAAGATPVARAASFFIMAFRDEWKFRHLGGHESFQSAGKSTPLFFFAITGDPVTIGDNGPFKATRKSMPYPREKEQRLKTRNVRVQGGRGTRPCRC